MHTIPQSKIILAARRWTQRGLHSELDNFFQCFPKAHVISTQHAFQRPYFLLKRIGRWAGQDGYTSYSAGIELAAMAKALKIRPKVMHFRYADHEYHYAWIAAKLVGAKLAGNFFFSLEEFERRMPNKSHLKHMDLLLASGKRQMEYLKQYADPEKIAYLPLGVETDFFSPPGNNDARLTGSPVLLHVGQNRRDIPTLKKVFKILKKQIPGLKLEMVLGDFAKDQFTGIEGVTFHPFLGDEDLVKVYQHAALLVLPLLEGGSSQTLNEAMSTGLPVITNSLPNLEDYASSEAVFMSQAGDAESMAGNCVALLRNRTKWEMASIAARQHALQFDFQKVKEMIAGYYESHLNLRVQTES